MTTDREYSPSDAADAVLGWKGRFRGKRLIRKVLAKEKRTGRQIFKRSVAPNGRTAYLITRAVIANEFPDLLKPTVESLMNDIRLRMDELENSISKTVATEVNKHMSSCVRQNSLLRVELKRLSDDMDERIRKLR